LLEEKAEALEVCEHWLAAPPTMVTSQPRCNM
jgi:hypothetical protein